MIRAFFYALAVAGLLLSPLPSSAQPKDKDKDEKKDTEREEVQSIKQIQGRFIADWIRDLESRDPAVRETAMSTLVWFGKAAHQALPKIIAELRDRDSSLRLTACNTIAAIGLGADNTNVTNGVAELCHMVNTDSQTPIRYQAILTLSALGQDGRRAIETFKQSMINPNVSWQIRKACAGGLGAVGQGNKNGPPDSRAVLALCGSVLKDPCAQVRLQAVNSLIALGPPNKMEDQQTVLNALRPLYRDNDKIVMIWSHMATMWMNAKFEPVHVTPIAAQLKSPDFNTRLEALKALAILGKWAPKEAQEHVRDIVEISLEDKFVEVILRGIETLAAIGDTRPMVMNALNRLANDREPQVKSLAQDAIKWLKDDKNKKRDPRKDVPKAELNTGK